MKKHYFGGIVALALWSLNATTAHADFIANVTLDTSVLAGNPGQGPFAVDFQLNDGSTGDGVDNNTATITNFNLYGGLLTSGTGNSTGGGGVSGVLGDNANPLTITDIGFVNDFNQQFTPSSKLSFTLDLTTNVSPSEGNGTGVPDEFSFAVYSNDFGSLASLLTIDITGPNPSITTSGGSLGNGTSVPPPNVSAVNASAVPEPSTLMLSALSLASLGLAAGCRRRMAATA